MNAIDLRSDTVTRPTPEMRRAMAEAEVGDDVYGEDPTVNRLQEAAARLLGFEAALWVPSGVMGNEIAIRVSTRPGDEVLAEERSHVVHYELAGMAALSGVMPRTVVAEDGVLTPAIVEQARKPYAYYRSDATLAVLENTHNLAGGSVYTVEQTRAAVDACHAAGMRVHLDGARLWNAAVALGVEPRTLAEGCDTVMVTLSKGLCAPAGSLLLATRERIEQARRVRKQLGGGMRQVGVLAAAGLVAIETMIPRLAEDHAHAQLLGAALSAVPGVRVPPVRTNIAVGLLPGPDAPAVVGVLRERGVLATAMDARTLRLTTHRDVSRADCERAASVLSETLRGVKRDLAVLAGRQHDLLVIGGGIYGAAVAWDGAQRGLAVGLVEAGDFGSGASWNSLKTIHGGLRHLQRADLTGLRESARERAALLRIAPALVRPLPFLVPTYGHGRRGRELLAAGLLANELLTLDRNRRVPVEARLPRSRLLSREEVLARVPGLDPSGLTGGALWHDAQVASTERLLMGFLEAASSAGAALANYAPVTALSREGARIQGAVVRDLETGTEALVRARIVVNAVGPDVGAILRLAGIEPPSIPLLHAANLVLRRPVVTGQAVGAQSEGRFLFLAPWSDRSIVGTDYRAEAPVDVDAFFEVARRAFPWAGLDRADVAVVHRGRVPGTSGATLWTRGQVIDHERAGSVPGLITLVSVKYTTARAAAEEAVDLACRRLGLRAPAARTAWTPLHAARPGAGPLAERARQAVEQESARHLTDAVLRRLDLGTGGAPSATEVATVLGTMAALLGWDEERQREERRALQSACAPPFAAAPLGSLLESAERRER